MGWESSDLARFDRGSFLQGEMGVAKFESAYNLLIIALRGLGCQTNLLEIIDSESSDTAIFDLGPLLQGQARMAKLKSAVFPVDTICIVFLMH